MTAPKFGIATEGFQVEGGVNAPGQPRNNWCDRERRGRIEPSGQSCAAYTRLVAEVCDS